MSGERSLYKKEQVAGVCFQIKGMLSLSFHGKKGALCFQSGNEWKFPTKSKELYAKLSKFIKRREDWRYALKKEQHAVVSRLPDIRILKQGKLWLTYLECSDIQISYMF